jgi:diguanylate cyclase (GGDEF)-like protein
MTPAPHASSQPIRVLVVDDEQVVLDAYREVLSDASPSTDRAAIQDLRARLFPGSGSAALAAQPAQPLRTFDPEFCNGAEAAVAIVRDARATNRPIEIVFLDMRMPPGPGGVWAAEQIRAIDPQVEIVVCTAYSDVDPGEISRRVPPADKLMYLQKPFHPHEVRQMAIALREKRWQAERQIAQLTHFDPLTGLPNRPRFLESLSVAVETARRHESPLAVLYVDLDNFKRINDTLGHGVGDEVLCLVAEQIRETLLVGYEVGRTTRLQRSQIDCARLGADEFMVLLRDYGEPQDAISIAERLLRALTVPMRLALHDVTVTASVGIAFHQGSGTDAETLFSHAGLAMYAAKRLGRGKLAVFDATTNAGALLRQSLEGRLHGALSRNEFFLHYQPQFDLSTGLLSGLEALLRWRNPELGTVSPMEFIPVAEETGLILSIGEWVLRTACSQVMAWREQGLPTGRIAVNVSGLQLAQRDFPAVVAKVLRETGLAPALLELEVTESLVMNDEAWAKQAFAELKNIGVALTIDDFGTGHSSFGRLSDYPVERLKIDRSFVRNIESLSKDRAIVAAIISMAKAIGVQVVAEGVEDFGQLLFLQEQGCDQAQGFLLSRPLPVAETERFLDRLAVNTASSRTQRFRILAT